MKHPGKQAAFWLAGTLLALVSVHTVYWLWLRPLLPALLEGEGPTWLQRLAELLYPRLTAEKQRFPLRFFVGKADQVAWRASLLAVLAGGAAVAYNGSQAFREGLSRFWEREAALDLLVWFRAVFYGGLFYYAWDFYWDLRALGAISELYRPLPLFRLLGLPFPGKAALLLMYGVFGVSCLMAALGVRPVASGTVAALVYHLQLGYAYSFDKTEHGTATLAYGAMLMPFVLWEAQKARKQGKAVFRAWALVLVRVGVAVPYLLGGLEKLFAQGLGWATAGNLAAYLETHPTAAGAWLARNSGLLAVAAPGVLAFELLFPLVLVFPKSRWVLLPTGAVFHLCTKIFLDAGAFFSPWVFMYLFFLIPLGEIKFSKTIDLGGQFKKRAKKP